MGCCGGKTRGQAAKDIANAHVRSAVGKITNARPPVEFKARYDKCRDCQWRTWLSPIERAVWILSNIGEIVVNPHRIGEQTMGLPVNLEQRKRDSLYCRACRCKCIVKARMPDGVCCKSKW